MNEELRKEVEQFRQYVDSIEGIHLYVTPGDAEMLFRALDEETARANKLAEIAKQALDGWESDVLRLQEVFCGRSDHALILRLREELEEVDPHDT